MENIISKVRATTFIHIATLEVTGSIFLCYGLAVANGHVPAWLPMISDCAVEAPEKYPFRLGIIVGAILMMVQVILAYYSETNFSMNRLCLILGLLASSGLGIVGAVNEKENNTLHSGNEILYPVIIKCIIITGSAVVFFFGYEFYMIIMAWYSISEVRVGITSLTVKQLCTIIAGIALIAFIVMSKFIIQSLFLIM